MKNERFNMRVLIAIAIGAVVVAAIATGFGAETVAMGGLLIAMLCATAIFIFLPGYIARQNDHPYATAIGVLGVLGLLSGGLLWIVAIVWALAVPKDAKAKAEPDGPGQFEVAGVDRESKYETSIVVEASNTANARAMGEVRGIHVTEVKRVTE